VLHVERTDEQVNEVLNEANEAEDNGTSRWPGMTYEQGVAAGISWVLGQTDEHPMAE
jgi:hypothetical protein